MSRSVIVRMRRRAPGERVEPFRRRLHAPAGDGLRDWLTAWALSVEVQVRDAWPDMPCGITDRPADVWEPLLAVADAAGGHWPVTARSACIELAKVAEGRGASLGVKLLSDLRAVFGEHDAMHTETILDALHRLDESPWGDLRGKPLDPRGLARRLRQYDIGSVDVKLGEVNRKGYRREHLWDTWTRYLPSAVPGSATCATSATEPGFQRESAPSQVAGSATSGSKRYPPKAESERESQLGIPGSAGSAPVETKAGTCSTCGTAVWPDGLCVVCASGAPEAENTPVVGDENCPICGHAVLIHVGIRCGICVGQAQTQLAADRAAAESDRDEETPS